MFYKLIATNKDITLTILRVTLGLVILPHGAQKVLGAFGGYGFEGTMGFFTGMGIPYVLALLAIIAEFFGAIGLILGLLTRVAAFGIFCTMLAATVLVHLPNGFFADKGGYEFHILTFGLAIPLIIKGAGSFSLDDVIAHKIEG
ncbi:DoxX family protein [Leptospira kemamanensis]|uniref:DoxX family protein n=1 Tax=Leptospira kemamanensis TaxID=2484942 RepID=A0A4R9JVJ0_9LEPT|nr:DoxX family protein [Leptospira kemamanensis]TGL55949.1 DoxX family protein [Leptospira kemamanensis]